MKEIQSGKKGWKVLRAAIDAGIWTSGVRSLLFGVIGGFMAIFCIVSLILYEYSGNFAKSIVMFFDSFMFYGFIVSIVVYGLVILLFFITTITHNSNPVCLNGKSTDMCHMEFCSMNHGICYVIGFGLLGVLFIIICFVCYLSINK